MFWNKVKVVAIVLVTVVIIGGVGGQTVQIVAGQARSREHSLGERAQTAAKAAPTTLQIQEPDKRAKEARIRDEELLRAAKATFEARLVLFRGGLAPVDLVIPWSGRWLKAELRLSDKQADKLAAHQEHVKRIKDIEDFVKEKLDKGLITRSAFSEFQYYRIEAEIWLDEAKNAK